MVHAYQIIPKFVPEDEILQIWCSVFLWFDVQNFGRFELSDFAIYRIKNFLVPEKFGEKFTCKRFCRFSVFLEYPLTKFVVKFICKIFSRFSVLIEYPWNKFYEERFYSLASLIALIGYPTITHKKLFASLFLNIKYVITKDYPEVWMLLQEQYHFIFRCSRENSGISTASLSSQKVVSCSLWVDFGRWEEIGVMGHFR